MLTSKDREILFILIGGAYGPILLSFMLYSEIFEFIVVGMYYSFFTSTIHHTQRYRDYLIRTSRHMELQNIQSRYTALGRSNVMITCLLTGLMIGVILFTLKLFLTALFG